MIGSPNSGPGERTRIALVRQKYRVDGGGERIVSGMASILRQQGHQITLLTRQWASGEDSVIRCNPPRVGRVLREWLFARAVTRILRQQSFDLVQSHERIPGCQVYRAGDGVHREWLRQRKRTLSSWSRRWLESSPYHRYLQHAEKSLFEHRNLRLVICNSRMVMKEILNHFDIAADKLRLVYNGVDTQRFHPKLRELGRQVREGLGIAQDASLFVFVGSGFERKGLAQTLDALPHVPDTHLMVIGKDKAMSRFQHRIQRLGLSQRVHLLGVQHDVGPFYGAADALVLPTRYDPFPNVVMEAMAAGLPVLTGNKCGAAELLREGTSGYVCDPLEQPALVQAMRRLADRKHARQLGVAARQAIEPFTLTAMRN